MDVPVDRERLLARFVAWAEARPDVRALALVGSSARVERPADEWSDVDLVVVVEDPQPYLASAGWLAEIGPVWVSMLEPLPAGEGSERRALFAGGQDVDMVFVGAAQARQALQSALMVEIAGRGLRVLVDKDGIAGAGVPLQGPRPPAGPPSAEAFAQVVHDFWYHCVWTAKKLRRGELWMAKGCCDAYMKGLLLRMVEWQARAGRGWDYDTWYNGRFLERWAAPEVVAALGQTFAHYDEADVWRALASSMALFGRLAVEVAGALGYPYPAEAQARVVEWVEALRAGRPNAGLAPTRCS